MKFILAICFLLLSFLGRNDAQAKAAYQSFEQMIANSDAIALVTIEKTVAVSPRDSDSWFREKSTARVERVFKGKLQPSEILWGNESFICAQCRFTVGHSLVFLRRKEGKLAGTNWHLSTRKIEGENIAWFGKGLFEAQQLPLQTALDELQKTLDLQNKAPRYLLSVWTTAEKPTEADLRWRIQEQSAKTGAVRLEFTTHELKEWLRKLPVGSKIAQRDSNPLGDVAPPELISAHIAEIRGICHWRGAQFAP